MAGQRNSPSDLSWWLAQSALFTALWATNADARRLRGALDASQTIDVLGISPASIRVHDML